MFEYFFNLLQKSYFIKNHSFRVPTGNYSSELEESTSMFSIRAYIMISELDPAPSELVIILDIGIIYYKTIKTHRINHTDC